MRRDGVRVAGVPEEPPLGVPDEVAVVAKPPGLAHVHAGRPRRHVLRAILAAGHHVDALDARRGARVRADEPEGDRDREHDEDEGSTESAHDLSPRGSADGSHARLIPWGWPRGQGESRWTRTGAGGERSGG